MLECVCLCVHYNSVRMGQNGTALELIRCRAYRLQRHPRRFIRRQTAQSESSNQFAWITRCSGKMAKMYYSTWMWIEVIYPIKYMSRSTFICVRLTNACDEWQFARVFFIIIIVISIAMNITILIFSNIIMGINRLDRWTHSRDSGQAIGK